jgi:hypothetical protein
MQRLNDKVVHTVLPSCDLLISDTQSKKYHDSRNVVPEEDISAATTYE